MNKYISLTLLLSISLSLVESATTCDTSCRSQCIIGNEGDSCVTACGCTTLANGLALKFGEQ